MQRLNAYWVVRSYASVASDFLTYAAENDRYLFHFLPDVNGSSHGTPVCFLFPVMSAPLHVPFSGDEERARSLFAYGRFPLLWYSSFFASITYSCKLHFSPVVAMCYQSTPVSLTASSVHDKVNTVYLPLERCPLTVPTGNCWIAKRKLLVVGGCLTVRTLADAAGLICAPLLLFCSIGRTRWDVKVVAEVARSSRLMV